MSTIEWTDETLNVSLGCQHISPGCKRCWAARFAHRGMAPRHRGLTKMTPDGPRWTGKVRLVPEVLTKPLHWRKPRMVFINSMSDLFHEFVSDSFIAQVFGVMRDCPRHTFQLLTKRAGRLPSIMTRLGRWPQNVWMGVTVEDRANSWRISDLRKCPAPVRFLSCEPLLEDLGELDLDGIDWCICGGESGPGARPMDLDWARSIRDQCVAAGVPFLFKQVGGVNKKRAGRLLDGRTWDEMPERGGV